MITYSDLVQQLLCFFILLLSISKIDVVKLKMFERGWIRHTGAPRPTPVERQDMVMALIDMVPDKDLTASGADVEGPPGEFLRVQRVHEGLRVVLEDCTMFAEGSAELELQAMERLRWLIDKARDKRNYIDIRGFTSVAEADSVNGDHHLLGYMRADAVARAMIGEEQNATIIPGRIRRSSRGAFDPLIRQTEAQFNPALLGRNRRVEIIISDELIEMNP
ncbi:MAG: hypothetical protein HYY93_16205 [Planctomycetes bacterium]|nr:hypothetical protein [Planctomycetota bacterium]